MDFYQIFPENNNKIGHFFWVHMLFSEVCPENSLEIRQFFFANLSLKILRNLTFFHDLSEALNSMARSIRFENIMDRSRYTFGGQLALFMRFGIFSMMKAKQDNMKCLF